MAEIGRWNGHKFIVSPELILGFTDLQIKASSETKEKKKSKQKYVKRKNGKPTEVTMTVRLTAQTGCDVRTEAMAFIADARAGKKDYFYVNNKKLVTCKLMLTDATVKEAVIPNGGDAWISADVSLTLKQAGKNSGTTSSTKKKKSKKASVKKKSTTKTRSSGTTKTTSKATGTRTTSKSTGTKTTSKSTGTKTTTDTKTKTTNKALDAIQKFISLGKKTTATIKATKKISTSTYRPGRSASRE